MSPTPPIAQPTAGPQSVDPVPSRICPKCGVDEVVTDGEAVWPSAWVCPSCSSTLDAQSGVTMLAPELAGTISGFDPASFDALATVEATHFWFVARNRLIAGLAGKYFPDAKTYLEVGCGNGAVLSAMAATRTWKRIVGTELQPAGLAYCRDRVPAEVELVQMDARRIPAETVFDLIGAFDVVEHIAEDDAVLAAMRRASRPGGGLILTVPQHPWLWSAADELAYHQRRYRRGELERKVETAGYRVLFSSSYTSTLLPLMAASRIKARLLPSKGTPDVNREFDVSPAVNRVFTSVLGAEVALTLAGMRWPAGGSRVVVAVADR